MSGCEERAGVVAVLWGARGRAVRFRTGEESWRSEAVATVCGVWAVHPTTSYARGQVVLEETWRITHAPTGRMAADGLTHEQALAVARRWARLPGIAALATVEDWQTPAADAAAAALAAVALEVAGVGLAQVGGAR